MEELKKCNWDKTQLQGIKERLGIKNSGKLGNNAKNYTYVNNGYLVIKWINNKQEGFGVYKKEEDAKRVVKELRQRNWDKTHAPAGWGGRTGLVLSNNITSNYWIV